MKKFIVGCILSLFAFTAQAVVVNISFDFEPGGGQVVKASPALQAGDVVNCKFHTPANLNVNAKNKGNFFVTQPVGNAAMIATFVPFGAKKVGLMDVSYQFSIYKLKPDTDYAVSVVVDVPTPAINCKLSPAGKR